VTWQIAVSPGGKPGKAGVVSPHRRWARIASTAAGSATSARRACSAAGRRAGTWGSSGRSWPRRRG